MFPSTRQSLVGRPAEGEFFERYRLPCLRYIQWRYPGLEAEDLVQGFFAAVIEQGIVERFDAARGRFRPYLRACLDQYIAKQLHQAQRQKRGGDWQRVELDAAVPAGAANPEEQFEREWERCVFEWALSQLQREHASSLRLRVFEEHDLADDPRPSYADLAARHNLTVTAINNHLAWARRELGRLVRQRL